MTSHLLRLKLAVCFCLTLILFGCGKKDESLQANPVVVSRGSRVVGMDTNDQAQDFSFTQSFSAAQNVGVSAGTLHVVWNGDEGAGSGTTSGIFTDGAAAFASANAYYPSVGAKLSLTIAPVDTGGFFLPSDLSGQPMDNSTVITRFNAFMDYAIAHLAAVQLVSIQIGNEVDLPSAASSATYWSQYKTFLTSVVNHIHAVKPGTKVGVTVSLYGLTSSGVTKQNGIISLLSVIDELGVTYYPLDGSFNVKSPLVAESEIGAIFPLVGTTPIYVQEVGYPTSSSCGGSAAAQASFIDHIFNVWDQHASQMPFLSFLRMNDYSHSAALSVASNYGLSANSAFVAYLESLGLRTYSTPSANKLGWSNLQARLHERGW